MGNSGNEYFLTDAISIMIESGAKVRTQRISTWLDTGTIEATLDTNKILLKKLGAGAQRFKGSNVKIVEPVAIHESAEISNSTIGPYASIGANCKIENSQIAESILRVRSRRVRRILWHVQELRIAQERPAVAEYFYVVARRANDS